MKRNHNQMLRHLVKQIELDSQTGIVPPEKAEELLSKLRGELAGYVNLQTLLMAWLVIGWFTKGIGKIVKSLVDNVIIELFSLFDRRVSRKVLWSPGFVIMRLIPTMGKAVGFLGIFRAEPELIPFVERCCVRLYKEWHMGFLIPILLTPSLTFVRKLVLMEWKTTNR